MSSSIEEHLGLGQGGYAGLVFIAKISRLHTLYTSEEIGAFYQMHSKTNVRMPNAQELSITAIFHGLSELMENLSDSQYATVRVNYFVLYNQLDYTEDISAQQMPAFIEFMRILGPSSQLKLLTPTSRDVALIDSCTLSPHMFEPKVASLIKLAPHTLRYALENEIPVDRLMEYRVDAKAAWDICSVLSSNERLRLACTKHLKTNSEFGDTAFLINEILGLGHTLNCRSPWMMQSLFCHLHSKHFYMPLAEFHDVAALTKYEMYLLYLSLKEQYSDDIDDIIELFNEIDDSAAGVRNEGVFDGESQLSIISAETKRLKQGWAYISMPRIFIDTLDLLLKRGVNFGFHKKAFLALLHLETEPYFVDVFCRHADRIVQHKLQPYINIQLYRTMERIINFLQPVPIECPQTPDACSLDELESDLILSSVASESKPRSRHLDADSLISNTLPSSHADQALARVSDTMKNSREHSPETPPLVSFDKLGWLSDAQANCLLRAYIKTYTAEELANNFLHTCAHAEEVLEFFRKTYRTIDCPMARGLIMCELALPIRANEFGRTTRIAILEKARTIYSFKAHIMYEKARAKDIEKFVNCLTTAQKDEINNTISKQVVNQEFILAYVDCLVSSYELGHIAETLEFLVESYAAVVTLKIQTCIIRLIEDMFFLETYFDMIGRLYKRMLRFEDKKIRVQNEKIISMVVACGNVMGRDVFIGNLKE